MTARDIRSVGTVPDGLQQALPTVGEDLYRFLEQVRRMAVDYQSNKADVLARIAAAASITSAPGPAGVPGPPGPPAAPATPDVTPPPTPSGVTVTAGLNTIFIETDDPVPIVTQGHGYQRTLVYGSTLASPTFLDAVLVHEFEGPLGSFSSNLGVAWKIWLTWKTNDGVESTTPSGGAGGHLATTGKIGTTDLNDLIITAGKLADGSITGPKLAVSSVDATKLALEMGGGNLLSNSSFEFDTNGDGMADSWAIYTAGTTGAAGDDITTAGVYGNWSQRVEATGLAAGAANRAGFVQTGVLNAFAGRKMVLSAWIRASSTCTTVLRIDWRTSGGAAISDVSATSVGDGTTFQRRTLSATAPATAAWADVYFYIQDGNGGLNSIRVDGAQLEFGDVPTSYAPRPDEILPNSVYGNAIQADAVTSLKIAAGAVTAAKTAIAAISSSTGNLNPATVAAFNLVNEAVEGTKIAPGAVSAAKTSIAAISSITGNLNTNTVDVAQLVNNAVTDLKIAAGAVTAAKTAIAAIDSTSGNLTANSVTANTILAGAVIAGKIAADAVTASTIAANAVVAGKIAADAVTATTIAAGAVIAGKIAADAVVASNIAAGAIVAGKIAAGVVTAVELAAGSVTTAKIVAGAVTATELASDSVTANKILAGAVVAGKIAANAVGANEIAANAVTTNKLLVTGRGMALNDDPGVSDISAWAVTGSVVVAAITDGPAGASALRMTGSTQALSRSFQATAGRQYRVSCYARKTSGAGGLYIRLLCQNAAGSTVNFVVTAITPAITNFENITASSSWVRYVGTITAGAAVVTCRIEIDANNGGSGDTDLQDVRAEEYIAGDVIVDGTISAQHLAVGSVTATKIAANAIAVGTLAVQNGAIVNAMIGALAVDSAKIADAAIVTAKIADLNVTGAKIANATITTAKIGTAQITTALIADANITGAKIASATITDANIASLNADKITAGAIRGINVNAGSFTTKGSYLTVAATGGDATLNVKDTSDFAASGSGFIIDTTFSCDAFTYTGKTATTLTGCSGVLAAPVNATVVPASKNICIDSLNSEFKVIGENGSGSTVVLASIGRGSGADTLIAGFGNTGFTGIALQGFSEGANPTCHIRNNHTGSGPALEVVSLGTGAAAIITNTAGSGNALALTGNGTKAAISIGVRNGRPTDRTAGQLCIMNTTGGSTDNRPNDPRLMFSDGTNWRLASDFSVWGG